MERLQGIAVSPGVAIGEALVMDNEGFRIPRRFLPRDAVEDELERLDQSIDSRHGRDRAQSRSRRRSSSATSTGRSSPPTCRCSTIRRLRAKLEEMIRQRHYSPEYSVSRVLRHYAKVFQSLEGANARAGQRHLRHREARAAASVGPAPRRARPHRLRQCSCWRTTSRPAKRPTSIRKFVRGFVTEVGGPGSHTAIVAEALGIPAVVGIGPFLTEVSGGETVIIDGDQGLVILHPDEETIARYRYEVDQQRSQARKLEALRDLPAQTLDGVRIQLLGNIEFPHEVEQCKERGSDGIGLYRTEFLFLAGDEQPTEEQQLAAYSEVAVAMKDQPVVMRTVDLGADKIPNLPAPEDERNPFLGLRSIRLALKHRPMFRTQLRAILRASVTGNIRMMFPLVSTIDGAPHAKSVLQDAKEDLTEEGFKFDRTMKIGMMVEVPSAVVMMDHFAHEVDFFSIGTNDLIQYALAVDRSNKDVAGLYTASDPSVLRLINMAVTTANAHRVPISMCGQMCGNPLYTMLLLGMGLRSLSVTPAAIPEIKRVCRNVELPQCEQVCQTGARNSTAPTTSART